MDLSDTFEYGQGYVALSRVRTLAGLSLAGLNKKALEIHPEISAKDASFREQSRLARETFAKMSASEIETMHRNFVRACGGSAASIKTKQSLLKPEKIPSREKTLELLLKKFSLNDIAKERQVSVETIVSHIEELCAKKKIVPARDLAHLPEADEKSMAKIRSVIEKVGADHLKPIFDHLGGRVPYETIRLARIFLTE
jgi:ATP-dependent DNA helicase PIF1